MDDRKRLYLVSIGYKLMAGNIYTKGERAEIISDKESYEDMVSRLGGAPVAKEDDDVRRPSLPVLYDMVMSCRINSVFGMMDMLSAYVREEDKDLILNHANDKKEIIQAGEDEDAIREGEEDDPVEYDLETEQQYYAAEWIKNIPTPILYRITVNGKRVYFEMGDDGYPIIYDGATNMIANGYCDKSGSLEKWKNKMRLMGKDPDEYARLRADFGTVMHYMYGVFLSGEKIKLVPSWMRKKIKSSNIRISKKNMEIITDNMMDELIEDMISFAIFCKERNVTPILIEKMLRSKRLKVASSVDLICEMDSDPETGFWGETYKSNDKNGKYKKGDPKESKRVRRIIAAIDFKSNREGNFYDEYAFQLELYRRMIIENYGKILNVEEIYNFAPGDPATKTSRYKLKRQTDNPILDMTTVVFLQGKKKFEKTNYTVTTRMGSLSIGKDFDLDKTVKVEPLGDYIYRVMNERKAV